MEPKEFNFPELEPYVDSYRPSDPERIDMLLDFMNDVLEKQKKRDGEIDDLLQRVRNLEKENLRMKDFIRCLGDKPKFQKDYSLDVVC